MIDSFENCTACNACALACPRQCIRLSEDEMGFLYPKVDKQRCIHCDKCEHVCHLKEMKHTSRFLQKAYATRTKSETALMDATSGGAFSAFAEYVLEKNGIIYGCAYTGKLKARHIRIDNKDELFRLNGSKYVQSDVGDSYHSVQMDLSSGKLVLFSGTPCQIAGLYGFLSAHPDNLLTIDIVCHGVSSQAYFDKYIEWFEEKHRCSLENYNFRAKSNRGWSLAGCCNGKRLDSNLPFFRKIYYYNEFYYFQFLKGMTYRKSCYNCKYANIERLADITLGDMWGAERLQLPFEIKNGCSLVLVNSYKGNAVFDSLDLFKKEITLDEATRLNKQLEGPSIKPPDYNNTIHFLSTAKPEEINRVFKRKYWKERMMGFIKYHIPESIRKVLKK